MSNDEVRRDPLASPGGALRAALADGVVQAIGVYDALGATIAERLGARAVYISGISLATSYGVPDVGLLTQTDVVEAAARVARAVEIPVLVDADTGYGGIANVRRTVELFEAAGIAGIQIEDQTSPKRSGEREGKTLVPVEEMQATVAAAKEAQRDPGFVLIARTDAISVAGYEDALARAQAYERAGADAIFPALPQSEEQIRGFGAGLESHFMITSSESGLTPLMPASRYGELGVGLVVYPMSLAFAAGSAMTAVAREILETGSNEEFLQRTDWSFATLEQHSGLEEWVAFEERARQRARELAR